MTPCRQLRPIPLAPRARASSLALVSARWARSRRRPACSSGEKAAGEWIKVRLENARLESAWLSDRPLLEPTVNGPEGAGLQTLEEKRDLLQGHRRRRTREDIATMQGKTKEASV